MNGKLFFGSRERGSQLVEFALVLPFLLVFVVGIFDFGEVYNLKQKLNNAAREAARFAINENSGGNLLVTGSSDVTAIRDVVQNYLTSTGVTKCAIAASPTASGFVYTFSSSTTGCGGFSLVIDREFLISAGPPATLGTHVTLTYPYTWSLGSFISLLVPGSTTALPPTISTDAIMQNIF